MDLLALVFIPWYLYLLVLVFKSERGFSKIMAPLLAWMIALYIPLFALGPAMTAFGKDVKSRLSDLRD